MRFHHVCVLLLFLSGFGCKKDPVVKDAVISVTIPQELKDYMYFLPGTYWVYKDTVSGIEDSVYVTVAANGVDTVYDSNGNIEGIWEWFTVDTESDNDGYEYYYSCSASWSTQNGTFPVFRVKTKLGDYQGQTVVSFNPFKVSQKLYPYSQNGVVSLTGISNSVNIGINTFYDVIIFNDSENITENDQETNFHISKDYGIIRKELKDTGGVWELVRFNIVK